MTPCIATAPPRLILVGAATRLTRACACGEVREALNATLYFI